MDRNYDENTGFIMYDPEDNQTHTSYGTENTAAGNPAQAQDQYESQNQNPVQPEPVESTWQQNNNGYYQTGSTNDYYYYNETTGSSGNSYNPIPEEPKKKKKKDSFGIKLVKIACLGLVFGLTAGAAIQGINAVSQVVSGNSSTSGSTTNNGISNVNIVRTSNTDVETIAGSDVSDIVSEVIPSIVAVNTVVESTSRDMFGRTYSQESQGAGSGIIFSEADNILYIVTNYHVVQGATNIRITFDNGDDAEATIKGYDSAEDIAVLTVDLSTLSQETRDAIKVAVIGDSDALQVGNGVIAIGNALGYGQSTTTGVVSALNREVQLTDGVMTLLQTDAAINPGNSGGALLNTRGEVIGINTVKYADTSVEGMGYAIPINDALETIEDIITGNQVIKSDEETPYLGIQGGTITEDAAASYDVPQGVLVSRVFENSAAERAGLEAGYIITGFNGTPVSTMEELQELLAECTPGEIITLRAYTPDDNYEREIELTTILGAKSEAASEY